MPLSQPLIPHPGFNNDTLQPSVISTTVTAGPSLSQWTFVNKYSNFINTGHGSSTSPHLPDYYPKGLKANLPNYFNPSQTYTNFYNTTLYPYLEDGAITPPYYIGSTTIADTTNRRPRMASPLPKPANNEGIQNLKTGDQFKEFTVNKKLDNIEGIYKIGSNSYVGDEDNPSLSSYRRLSQGINVSSNIQPADALRRAGAIVALGAASGFTGSPRLIQLGSAAAGAIEGEKSLYNAVPFKNLGKVGIYKYLPFQDFRARKGFDQEDLLGKRLDGTASALRAIATKSGRQGAVGGAYAAASLLTGAYTAFNLEATYGFGEHGTPYALRNDFTAKSHVATYWDTSIVNNLKSVFSGGKVNIKGAWRGPTARNNPIAKLTPFRGDKVTVIDFKQTTLDNVYNWQPSNQGLGAGVGALGAAIDKISGRVTKDFIKFFLTGPSLTPFTNDKDKIDDVMVFRAIITSLTDSYNPSWNPTQFIGRADPSYNYTGYSRDINLDFTVYATDRDELKPIWRKLNALAGYTAPEYDGSSIALKGPYLRLTVGDLYYQQPLIINSLYFTLQDSETTWETNIEEDMENMEVPKQIQVSLGGTLITDYLPQKGGRFYTLSHKEHLKTDSPNPGPGNWLSDMKTNKDVETAGSVLPENIFGGIGVTQEDINNFIESQL